MIGASHSSACSQSSEVLRYSPRLHITEVLVVKLGDKEELAAGDYTDSALPVQRVNYSEAEDLKIQLAKTNKQTKTQLSHC